LRMTGGEPLLRENMPDLIERLNNIDGIEDIGLTTNGVLLGKYAEPLYDAGLRRLNLSLDALDPFVFGEMNGRGTNPQIVLKNKKSTRLNSSHVSISYAVFCLKNKN